MTPEGEALTDRPILAVLAVEEFACNIGLSLHRFFAGQLISNLVLVMELIAQKAPVLEVFDFQDVVCCPHCGRYSTDSMLIAE